MADITSRGNERKAIYRDDRDRFHFLDLLGETGERYRIEVHAYALMENHFHFMLQSPDANLSRALQWLESKCPCSLLALLTTLG